MECQLECQPLEGHAHCEGNLEGGCEAECEEFNGVLECNGEYVDHGGHAEECIDSINAFIESHVQIHAEGSADAECEGNECTAEAEGKASCECGKIARSGADNTLAGLGLLAGLAGLLGLRRRRRH